MAKSASPVVDEEMELLEFVRYPGPGTILYPSPRPGEAKDMALPAMIWVQVDPAYRYSGIFARDRKNGVFEYVKAESTPNNLDLSIDPQWDGALSADQRELLRCIVLSTRDPIPTEYVQALEISKLVNDAGQATSENVTVTVNYLRTRQRPFLMALLDVEGRYQKRPELMKLLRKQIARIETLPGK